MKNLPLNFKPKNIKKADVKNLYVTLRTSMPELPFTCKHFRDFDLNQLDTACQKLKINVYILDCKFTNEGQSGKAGCLSWHSKFVEGGLHLNMLRVGNDI